MEYRKLKGKIKEVYGLQENFAKALEIDPSTLSLKMNNNSPWKREEIVASCELLGIPIEEVHLYFFTQKVGKSQHT